MDKPNALGITADEFKAIEQTRQRLFQLSNSIQASLQAQSQILLRNLQSLLETLTENTHVFQHLHVFPDVAYPGRVHENILLQLLRKKLEPGVEEWVERGRETTRELRGANVAPPSSSDGSSVGIGGGPGIAGGPVGAGNGGGEAQLEAVWRDVRAWTVERVQKYVLEEAGDVYTEDERRMGVENVRTGLRRGLEEDDEDDDDEDEESDEEGGGGGDGDVIMSGQSQKTKKPTKPTGPEPEMLFWFEARGDFDLPRNVDLLSQAGMKRGR
ncbi:RNA polymerase II mediator complex component Med8 [Colletotrichum tamarilloi]|uniref:Mediator of RNA polymerase II transcription subunit 8 n=1 Tax=Colletotrichum tamarilloi TaxID=1209934 RepID=A0ABQ9QPH3_9PEZI|nr:RNA polymerase II mediator complex component Med8 [Colletotrichum tamarilloi]KAK1480428.1 RNA polymerase II mediator complex component Med8 [Colletotrichum tamarilloi]